MMTRPDVHETMLAHAAVAAFRSTCPAARVGAVIARHDVILAVGYNGAPRGAEHCDVAGCVVIPAVIQAVWVDPGTVKQQLQGREYSRHEHAERNVIAHCARLGIACDGCRLYVTKAPCLDCLKLAANAGIVAIILSEAEWKQVPGAVMDFAGECNVVILSQHRLER